MGKQSVDVLVSGGKATAAPPLGPALGPLGVNIGQVVAEINSQTKSFAGMQVPVKVTVDEDTKTFEISIGTPPTSNLIKKELNLKSGASTPESQVVGDLNLEQIKKIADMKKSAMLGKDTASRVFEVAGTCKSMGVTIDGQKGDEFVKAVKSGKVNL